MAVSMPGLKRAWKTAYARRGLSASFSTGDATAAHDFFRFEVVHTSSRSEARAGVIHTPHGSSAHRGHPLWCSALVQLCLLHCPGTLTPQPRGTGVR